MRKPGQKKRGSRIGFIIDPFRRRKIRYESGLEEYWGTVLVVRRNVANVLEQQVVHYRDGNRMRTHVFDFIVTWTSGRRTAYAVKYAEDVTDELVDTLHAVNDNHGNRVADSYEILSEDTLDEVSIANAQLTLSCCLDFDDEGCRLLIECLQACSGELSLGDLVKLSGLGSRGYRAAISLARDRHLIAPAGQRLNPDLIVKNCVSRFS